MKSNKTIAKLIEITIESHPSAQLLQKEAENNEWKFESRKNAD
tara:strand:+ start:64 stop:192 length:129 start_codon:yes stop_codon:yes gene_type:complete